MSASTPARRLYNLQLCLQLAMLEGEGWGTAYEHLAKWRAIARHLNKLPIIPRKLAVAGLPDKYAFGLFFILYGLVGNFDEVEVIDHGSKMELTRALLPQLLDLWKNSTGEDLTPRLERLRFIAEEPGKHLAASGATATLVLSADYVQRLTTPTERAGFLNNISTARPELALIFAPNRDNRNLVGQAAPEFWTREELGQLSNDAGLQLLEIGFADIPPFPSGFIVGCDPGEKETHENYSAQRITRQEARKHSLFFRQPISGLACIVLKTWANLIEGPDTGWRRAFLRHRAHISYCVVSGKKS